MQVHFYCLEPAYLLVSQKNWKYSYHDISDISFVFQEQLPQLQKALVEVVYLSITYPTSVKCLVLNPKSMNTGFN